MTKRAARSLFLLPAVALAGLALAACSHSTETAADTPGSSLPSYTGASNTRVADATSANTDERPGAEESGTVGQPRLLELRGANTGASLTLRLAEGRVNAEATATSTGLGNGTYVLRGVESCTGTAAAGTKVADVTVSGAEVTLAPTNANQQSFHAYALTGGNAPAGMCAAVN